MLGCCAYPCYSKMYKSINTTPDDAAFVEMKEEDITKDDTVPEPIDYQS